MGFLLGLLCLSFTHGVSDTYEADSLLVHIVDRVVGTQEGVAENPDCSRAGQLFLDKNCTLVLGV